MRKINIKYLFPLIFVSLTIQSCKFFSSKTDSEPIAKVHDVYLYEDDLLKFHFPAGLSEKDSVALLTEYIDNWATQQLLVDQAKQNMPNNKQEEFDYMVRKYENELYSSAYKNVYAQQNLNAKVTNDEIESYYGQYKGSFLLKEDLLKVRYVQLPQNFKDVTATKKLLSRYKEKDIEELSKMLPGFNSYYLNEKDEWMSFQDLVVKIPNLVDTEASKIVNTNTVNTISDKNGKYLIKAYSVLKIGKPAPMELVKEEIEQIILNKRKLELQKKLEKEIIKDALQAKDYTIYH